MRTKRLRELVNIYRRRSTFIVRVMRVKGGVKVIDVTRSFNADKIGSTKQAKDKAVVHRDNLRRKYPISRTRTRINGEESFSDACHEYIKLEMHKGLTKRQARNKLRSLLRPLVYVKQ